MICISNRPAVRSGSFSRGNCLSSSRMTCCHDRMEEVQKSICAIDTPNSYNNLHQFLKWPNTLQALRFLVWLPRSNAQRVHFLRIFPCLTCFLTNVKQARTSSNWTMSSSEFHFDTDQRMRGALQVHWPMFKLDPKSLHSNS